MISQNLTLPFAETVRIGRHLATVIRSPRRKTVEIQIRGDEVVVRAPARMSARHLQLELQRSEKWVDKKLAISRLQPREVERRFVSGETISFLGRQLILEIRRATRSRTTLSDDILTVLVSARVRKREEFIRNAIITWISAQACSHLEHRADLYAGLIGVKRRGLRVKSFKTLWGSCSRSGELSFNWRIMMAPGGVIDYVVAHELAHCHEFNHSAKFWGILESVIPDYRERRQWLHHNASLLNI
jgi:predicted metal-dependent hydrolase